jgi:hypothetical protein
VALESRLQRTTLFSIGKFSCWQLADLLLLLLCAAPDLTPYLYSYELRERLQKVLEGVDGK